MATERLVTTAARGPDESRPASTSAPTTPANPAASRAQPDQPADAGLLDPGSLDDYVGQAALKERLRIAIDAARGRGEPMDHLLLHGPPGLGKTTMAQIVAVEMGVRLHRTSGPALSKGTELAQALQQLGPGDVLFIDEIHRLPVAVEEFVYPAMERLRIDVTLDAGLHARTVQLPIKPFTLVGATTRAGLLSAPLRSRFHLNLTLDFYAAEELLGILERSARLLGIDAERDALARIAGRCRGTPRLANRLLRRVRDYAQVRAGGVVDLRVVDEALALAGVDDLGLDELDRRYLAVIKGTYAGGPVGIQAIAATLGEDAGTLEDVVEPYLLRLGLVARTSRGRELTQAGRTRVRDVDAGSLWSG